MNLPPDFIQRIQAVFGDDGKALLKDLPGLIEHASARWGVTDVRPVSNLSYNFVAFASSPSPLAPLPQGEGDVILKIGVPRDELTSEMNVLKLFNGNGACRLLDCNEEKGFLLIERLNPGQMLSDLGNDDERTHIAVDVMTNLWRDIHAAGDGDLSNEFIKLSDWFDALGRIRPRFDGGTGPFPKGILENVESFLPDLFAEDVKLLHGDFHHYNILSSQRGWLAIDPKGVIGPAGYEIGPLMINPWNEISDWRNFKAMTKRRVDILSERLGWERETIIHWAMAHAVLSTWWSIEDGEDWEYSLNCANVFSEIFPKTI